MDDILKDAFKLMCGEVLGEGCDRVVYECKLMNEWVVKTEKNCPYEFSNIREHTFWHQYKNTKKIAKWLAPCGDISPDGKVLLQRRATPLEDDYKLPRKLPKFLSDIKRSNFGLYEGRLVCVDYADAIVKPSTKKVKIPSWI